LFGKFFPLVSHRFLHFIQLCAGATYERLDPGGPKRTGCSATKEFVTPYFTCPEKETLEEEMELLYSQEVRPLTPKIRNGIAFRTFKVPTIANAWLCRGCLTPG